MQVNKGGKLTALVRQPHCTGPFGAVKYLLNTQLL